MAVNTRGFGATPRLHFRPPTPMSTRPEAGPGLAVRRDWPGGAHDIVHFGRSPQRIARWIETDKSYWRRGPASPEKWSVVEVEPEFFATHRWPCDNPLCPRELTTAQSRHWAANDPEAVRRGER